ncbi:hypothetical protein FACS189490_11710 [Clostridia bacterium]|nr:hypothetical protein FACS189490_11710 [Clostridia bacterium]
MSGAAVKRLIVAGIVVIILSLTGVLRAIVEKRLSSRIGSRGIVKKVAIFLVVGIGHLADMYLFAGDGDALRTAVAFFYIANEGLSVLENSVAIGLPVPARLKDALTQLRDKNDKGDDSK